MACKHCGQSWLSFNLNIHISQLIFFFEDCTCCDKGCGKGCACVANCPCPCKNGEKKDCCEK